MTIAVGERQRAANLRKVTHGVAVLSSASSASESDSFKGHVLGDRHSVRDGHRLVAGELRAAAPSSPTTANGLMARSTGRFPGQGRKSAMRCAFTSLELWSRQRVSFCAKAVAKT